MRSFFQDKRKATINILFSAVFSACQTVGWQLENRGATDFGNIFFYLLWMIVFAAVLFVLSASDGFLSRKDATSKVKGVSENTASVSFSGKRFFITWVLFFISYIPALLAAWPGFFCYDAEIETYEVFTFKYSNHHPLIHELLLGNCLRLGMRLFGNYNAGITIYTILQMAVMSCIFSYMLTTLHKYGMSKKRHIFSFLFLAFFPTMQIFITCSTKDVLFTGGVILFTTELLRKIHSEKGFILLFVSVCMMLFFRNNGIYILPVFCILVFFFAKELRRILPVLICGMVFYLAATEALIYLLPAKRGETAELLSVPMQQLARVHSMDKSAYSPEDLDILYTLIPEVILENYNPKLADNVKVNFLEDNFKADPGKYISLYLRALTSRPGICADACGIMSDGYWFLSAPIVGYKRRVVGGTELPDSSYFQYTIDNPGVAKPILKGLNSFYKSLSFDMKWQKMPLISLILLPSFYIWVYLTAFSFSLKEKKNKGRIIFWIPGLLFLTMLLGPIALVRYALPFYMMIPIIITPEALRSSK